MVALLAIDPYGYLRRVVDVGDRSWVVYIALMIWAIRHRSACGYKDDWNGFWWSMRRIAELLILVKGPSWVDVAAINPSISRRTWLAFLILAKAYAVLSFGYACLSLGRRADHREDELLLDKDNRH